jgi:hypothetical protein
MSVESRTRSIGSGAVARKKSRGRRYVAALGGGALCGLVALFAFYLILDAVGRLPPPPLSNSICVDEKLAFLNEHPPADPNFLVVGSSIAWRNFDSSVVAQRVPHARPLNGGFCGLYLNQTVFVTGWLLEHLPSIHDVVLLASPLDYEDCRHPDRIFDPMDAGRFVFEQQSKWTFYLRYFDPVSLIRNIERQAAGRARLAELGASMVFTDYGDGPLDTTRDRGLFYGTIGKPDPNCFSMLRSLAQRLAKENRRFIVVTGPLHPKWKELYDPDGKLRHELEVGIIAALEGTGGEYWNGDVSGHVDSAAFTDAIHLRWSAVRLFTERFVEQLLL